ncbi:hypothetical protein PLESTB_000996900 [Pleodorina starrii]|uniref:Arginine decarboxylase n=1 Tax=Pleodorina starrii TaxID=330485 RepID=A0A9W6BNV7_9CHLO|nr:hypothetical protein PLESTB_000996900 [Pleodorina starrii]
MAAAAAAAVAGGTEAAAADDSGVDPAPAGSSSASVPSAPAADPLRQQRTPLVDAVRQRGDAVHEAPFHVPGHKRGARTPEGLARLVRPAHGSVLQYDLTEIAGLDYLSSPSGVIQEAQQLAAEVFGADHTWFLVNGCSVGIHAAVMAVTAAAAETAEAAAAAEAAVGAVGLRSEATGPSSSSSRSKDSDSARSGGARSSGDARTGVSGGGGVTLVVARNCHSSAFSAMVLAGCEPYWVQPEVDPVFGVAHCVTHGSVREALCAAAAQGRRVAGVLIVSPTYFGAVADVQAIAEVCHEHDVPLLVDEAHGGHFAFLPPAPSPAPTPSSSPPPPPPPSALRCGADLVMQSSHKVLGAMTQAGGARCCQPPSPVLCLSIGVPCKSVANAAMLHASGPRVSPSRLTRALQALQSSSPSYLLLASLDAARAQVAAGGAFREPCAAAQAIRAAVASGCQRVRLLDERTAGSKDSVRHFDPLRLTLLVSDLRLPGGGFQAAEWLERQYGVVPELATAKTVVLALGPGTTMEHAARAITAISELDRLADPQMDPAVAAAAREAAAAAAAVEMRSEVVAEVEVVLTPRAAHFAAAESVPAAAAVGRVSAELLCPYPPGVPVLFPGERVTAAALEVLRSTLAAGGAVTGARDGSLATLQVVAMPAEE